MNYVAFIRGINVGGARTVNMAELKQALSGVGLYDVRTYINSGNLLFHDDESSEQELATKIEQVINEKFGFLAPTVVLKQPHLKKIVDEMPNGWNEDSEWKYNLIFLIPPYDSNDIVQSIGQLKPDIEHIVVGDGVLYQSMSRKHFGRTTTSKLASNPVYQKMTIRTTGTVRKLLSLLEVGMV